MSKKSDEQLVRESWALATKAFTLQQIGDLFYATLFEQTPSVRTTLFKDTNVPEQALKLIQMIDGAIKILDRPTELVPVLVALGERHGFYGTEPAHFGPVGKALITTLQKGLGSAFTSEVQQAWLNIYGVIQGAMTEGLNNAKGRANRASYDARMRKAAKKDESSDNALTANLPLIVGVVAVAAVAYYFVSKRN